MFNKLKEKLANKRMKVEAVECDDVNAYLSKFNCPRCHNHCKLSKLKCGAGLAERTYRINEFNAKCGK